MIFNPLFLSENVSGQTMAPKQNKMSNNKYLFADIVKVVMNPITDQQESAHPKTQSTLGSNIGLTLDKDQTAIKLKLKFLSDIDNEQAKLGLAEILPIEIAQLLVNDEMDFSGEDVVSYISKEPLKGELKTFINNLVGTEIIENNISNKSGLLLSLEDSKSAVNLELAQVSEAKSNSDKIVVQTLVIPEKSKLISLMGEVQNKNGLFRIDNSSLKQLGNITNQSDETSKSDSNVKPTLSVYSFNYGGEKFESLTKSIKTATGSAKGLSLYVNSNLGEISKEVKNVPLDKSSLIPSDIKENQVGETNIVSSTTTKNQNGTNGLKLIPSDSKLGKDFSVNKITIVKKQADISSTENKVVEKNLNTETGNTSLKRIDFASLSKSSSKEVNNIDKSIQPTNIKFKPQQKNISNIKEKTQTLNSTVEQKHKSASGLDQVKIEPAQPKQVNIKEHSNLISKGILNSSKTIIPNDNSISDNVNEQKTISSSSNKTIEKMPIVEDPIINKMSMVSKENSEIKNIDSIKIKSIEVNNTQNNTLVKEEINTIEPKEMSTGDKKNLTPPEAKSNSEYKGVQSSKVALESKLAQNKGEMPIANEPEVDSKIENLNTGNPIQTNDIEPQRNKKVSVKVKSVIKSVSETKELSGKVNTEVTQKETSSQSGNNQGNGDLKSFNNSAIYPNQFEMKIENETAFQQILNKEEASRIENIFDKPTEIDSNTKQRVVKSMEVLREVSKFISKQEKGTLSFDIKPEQLGRMKITLDTTDHVLKAMIEVDNEQAKQLIEKNLDKLYQELNEKGVELSALNISLGNPKQKGEEKEQTNQDGTGSQSQGQVGETEENENKKSLGYNTYEYIA